MNIFNKKRDEEEVNIKESRSKPNIDCAIMCSAQELHTYTDFEIDKQYFFTYTDFEIDKQYFFSAFSQLHEVFLKYDTFASNICTVYTKHDGFPFMVLQSD